jgi:hypothetical protein
MPIYDDYDHWRHQRARDQQVTSFQDIRWRRAPALQMTGELHEHVPH